MGPRLSWLGQLLASMRWVVLRQFWQRALWVLFPATAGWGMMLALVA